MFKTSKFNNVRKELASNINIPDELMREVIKTQDKQTLWAATRNPNISPS